MALKAGVVQALPDLACVGVVKKVGEAYLSQKEVYTVLPIEIEAKYAGRDGLFFYLFQPRWFGASFDPQDLLSEDSKGTLYGMYRRYVADAKRPSALQALGGAGTKDDVFTAIADAFNSFADPSEKDVENIIRQNIVGRDVGYIMSQRKDENKELTEQYNIARFFPLTDEELKYITEQSGNPKRKTPLVVTWDEQ